MFNAHAFGVLDSAYGAHTPGVVARAKGMAQVAKATDARRALCWYWAGDAAAQRGLTSRCHRTERGYRQHRDPSSFIAGLEHDSRSRLHARPPGTAASSPDLRTWRQLGTFLEAMAINVDDGVRFDLEGLRIEAIGEAAEYSGSRLRTSASLARARIPISVDIGFGDAVEPGGEGIELAVMLAFARRHTSVPALVPDGLSDAFATDPAKQRQWHAFARNLASGVPELRLVVTELRQRLTPFLVPP